MLRLVIVCLAFASALASAEYGKSRCYSCNYAPSGYGYHRAGAPQCALQSEGHSSALDQWACKSGKCFVRLDKNGLVYRGCANQENLPLGVSSYNRQCQYQAGSLWFFCDGDLCNSKQLGKVCAYKPAYKPKSPCDGSCYGNPSGLFPAYDKKSFIQCGCGSDAYGNTCTCCVPFHFKCPYGTSYNDYLKVCV